MPSSPSADSLDPQVRQALLDLLAKTASGEVTAYQAGQALMELAGRQVNAALRAQQAVMEKQVQQALQGLLASAGLQAPAPTPAP